MVLTKNKIVNKIFICFLVVLLYVSMLLTSYRSASASVSDLLGKGTEGAIAIASYVLSGVLVAGGAAAAAVDEYKPQIQEAAKNAYDSFGQAEKELWLNAAKLSFTTSQGILTVSEGMIDSLSRIKDSLSDSIMKLLGVYESSSYLNNPNASLFVSTAVSREFGFDDRSIWWTDSVHGVTSPGWRILHKFEDDPYTLEYLNYNFNWTPLEYRSTATFPEIDLVYKNIDSYGALLSFIERYFYSLTPSVATSAIPPKTYFNDSVDAAIAGLGGVKEVNIPLDQFLATNTLGHPVTLDTTTGAVLNPDGTVNSDPLTWDYPLPVPGVVPGIAAPAVPITGIGVTDVPLVGNPPTTGTPPGTGGTSGNPFTNLVPVAFLMALLDLLRAILMYLARMFTFVLTIPLIPIKTIDNVAFQWFREAKIVGIYIYQVVSSLASIGLSFMVYRAIRKVLP